jgi:hypothetical protein
VTNARGPLFGAKFQLCMAFRNIVSILETVTPGLCRDHFNPEKIRTEKFNQKQITRTGAANRVSARLSLKRRKIAPVSWHSRQIPSISLHQSPVRQGARQRHAVWTMR